MNKEKQWLEDNAQAVFGSLIQCLEWFVGDDLYILYTMIEENISLDDWFDEMSHRIVWNEDTYYILEEDDMIEYRNNFWLKKGE